MTAQKHLLGKYYKGETSLEEEKELKEVVLEEEMTSAEQDMFGFFEEQATVPGDLEESIFSGVQEKLDKRKVRRMRWYSITSAAAVVLVVLSVYFDFRNNQRMRMENDFFVMERALYQVSESLQPEEQEEMLVLWVDDDVEIIVN